MEVQDIAQAVYEERYRQLEKDEKDLVDDIQVQGHKWTNDHANLRVFSTACDHWVTITPLTPDQLCKKCKALLDDNHFKVTLRKPTPHSDNF